MLTFPFRVLFVSSTSSPLSNSRLMKRTRPGARQQAAHGLGDTNAGTKRNQDKDKVGINSRGDQQWLRLILWSCVIVACRIIWHTSELIIWRTGCESGVKRRGEGTFRGNMKL
jgi:hypothetical protein